MYNDDDFNEENEDTVQGQNKILDFYYANKKLIWILIGVVAFILLASIFLGGGNNNNQSDPLKPTVVITSLNEVIAVNNSKQLIASVTNIPSAVLYWTSSNPSVATVDSSTGLVTALSYGTSIITASYTHTDNQVYSVKCEVVVAEGDPSVKVDSVKFQEGDLMISVGDEYTLPIIITPSNGYVTNVKYASNNKDVIEVDVNGKVKALKQGEAIIKLDVNDGQFTDEIKVNVLSDKVIPQIVVNPSNLSFVQKLISVQVGEVTELEYEVLPIDAPVANFSWQSSDESVATVSNGVVTGLKIGKTDITVSAINGVKDKMTVNVVARQVPVESVEILSDETINLMVSGVSKILANVIPLDASNKKVTYKSTNQSVATVDDEGLVKAVGVGNAQIIVEAENGNKSAIVNVVVSSPSSGSVSGSGQSSSIGTLKYRDQNDLPAYTNISTALSKSHVGPVTISVNTGVVDKITLCVKKCVDNKCEDNVCDEKEVTLPYTIDFTEGNGLYVIRATKYNGSRFEETAPNYVNITNATTSSDACYYVNGVYKWGKFSSTGSLVARYTNENDCLAQNNKVTPSCTLNQSNDYDVCVTPNLTNPIADSTTVNVCVYAKNGLSSYKIQQSFLTGGVISTWKNFVEASRNGNIGSNTICETVTMSNESRGNCALWVPCTNFKSYLKVSINDDSYKKEWEISWK